MTATAPMPEIAPSSASPARVLCLHGLFAGAWVFDGLKPMLAARGYSATAIDFRCGAATAGRCSLTEYRDQAAAAARKLGKPVVIAHSMGGLVAQMLAAQQLVRAVVLVSSAPPRGIPVLSMPLLTRMGRYLPDMVMSRPFVPTAEDLDALVLNRMDPDRRKEVRDRLVPDSGRVAREIAVGRFGVRAKDVRVPILVMGSDDDRFVPPRVAERLAQRYHAPIYMAGSHGHFLFGEPGWERHAKVMLDWIDNLPTRDDDWTREPRTSPAD